MYLSRAIMIAIFLIAPKTTMTFYIFAIALDLTWLATVPPTASAVGKLFGNVVWFDVGESSNWCLFGAYFGGLAIQQFGDYQLMWYADIILAVLAGVAYLPIR